MRIHSHLCLCMCALYWNKSCSLVMHNRVKTITNYYWQLSGIRRINYLLLLQLTTPPLTHNCIWNGWQLSQIVRAHVFVKIKPIEIRQSFSIGIVVPVPESVDKKVASSFHFQNQGIWEGDVFQKINQSFSIGIVVPVPESVDIIMASWFQFQNQGLWEK